MNTIKVPFIEGIEKMSYEEMDMAMETGAAKSFIGCVNWQEYPYRPDVAFSVARSRTHLAVLYHVRGLDLRAMAMEDNGNVWEEELDGKIFGWSVGMCVPFDLIGADPDNLPSSIRANFYKCADKSAHPHFLSWSPIDVPSPDFHRPEFFGELILQD